MYLLSPKVSIESIIREMDMDELTSFIENHYQHASYRIRNLCDETYYQLSGKQLHVLAEISSKDENETKV